MPEQRDMTVGSPAVPPAAAAGNGFTGRSDGFSSPDAAEPEVVVEQAAGRKMGVLGWASIGWLVLMVGTALLAPILPLEEPGRTAVTAARVGPFEDAAHILGSDGTGRDMLSETIHASRSSLLLAMGSVIVGTVVGGFLGLIAGYVRGPLDTVLSLLFNVILSIPALVLAMSLVAVFASSDSGVTYERRMTVLVFTLALVVVPVLGRITRASTLAWAQRDFVKAAEAIGSPPRRIMVREVLPNVVPAMMSIALLFVAIVIVAEGSLALLGVGIEGAPSWGNMIAMGRIHLERAPHVVFVPAVAIFLTVLSLNYLGDVIRARFDVRESVI